MSYYRKPAQVVEAVVWDGSNMAEVDAFVGDAREWQDDGRTLVLRLWVGRSSAWCLIYQGGAIVREPDGRGFYPVMSDVVTTWKRVDPEVQA